MRKIKQLLKHVLGVMTIPEYPNVSSSSRVDPTAQVSTPENLMMGEHS